MVETAQEVIGDKLPLLGGAMDTSTRRVLDKAAALEAAKLIRRMNRLRDALIVAGP